MDPRSTLLVVGGSTCSFKLLNAIIKLLPAPDVTRKADKSWKWRNIWTSLAHSSLTGAGAAFCLYRQPQMVKDLIASHSLLSNSLVAVSTGYFIHDFLDNALNQSLKKCWELLSHHAAVFCCFSLALTTRLYLGLSVVSLLIEINSVFLHVRQLLLLAGRRNRRRTDGTGAPRPTPTYTLISSINLGTLLVFRVGTIAWIARWMVAHRDKVPRSALMVGAVGTCIISAMSIGLFCRLLKADVLPDDHKTNRDH